MAKKTIKRQKFNDEQVIALRHIEEEHGQGLPAIKAARNNPAFKGERPRRSNNAIKLKLNRLAVERSSPNFPASAPIKTGNSGLPMRMTLTDKGKPSFAFSLMEILPLVLKGNYGLELKIYNLIKNEL